MNASNVSRTAEYAYRHVTPDVLSGDMRFSDGAPVPGDSLPGFDLPLAEGGRLGSETLVGTRPFLLVTGSFTCPMTASSNPLLKQLHSEFGGHAEFVMVHVREAHPGEQREQPGSHEEKMRHARELKRRDALPFPVVVDDPAGAFHRALDGKPNSAWLVDRSGRIVFRSLWVGDARALRKALKSVARGERPVPGESQRRLVPMARGVGAMREMVRTSGPRAKRDLWRTAPPMAALAWMADLYRPLPHGWRTIAAVATLAVAVTTVVAVVRSSHRER